MGRCPAWWWCFQAAMRPRRPWWPFTGQDHVALFDLVAAPIAHAAGHAQAPVKHHKRLLPPDGQDHDQSLFWEFSA